jgi:phosphopantetheinyl transferase (holo-ACP synthase)
MSLGRDGDDLPFELEALDPSGRVTEQVTGLVLSRAFSGHWEPFDYPIAERLRCHPERAEIARLLGLPEAVPLTGVSIDLVESAARHRGEPFLQRWLSAAERQHYDGLQHDKRRRDWLAGRFAAKACLRFLPVLEESAPAQIAIVADDNGVPHVEAPGLAPDAVLVTIAHSWDRAVAAAAEGLALGVDVERATRDIEGIAAQFCAEEEAALIADHAGLGRQEALMTIWVAKEAALKVIGAHNCLMKDLSVCDVAVDGGYVVCTLEGAGRPRVRAVSMSSGDYFYAVAAAADGNEH